MSNNRLIDRQQEKNCKNEIKYGIVFCLTGKESAVTQRLESNIHGLSAISPMKLRCRRIEGALLEEKVVLFPGYVFFRTTEDIDTQAIIQDIDIIKVLYTDIEKRKWHLSGQDKAIVEEFFRTNGVVELSNAYFDSENRIHISDGFLKEYERHIIRVNRRAKTVEICIELSGKKKNLWLGYKEIT